MTPSVNNPKPLKDILAERVRRRLSEVEEETAGSDGTCRFSLLVGPLVDEDQAANKRVGYKYICTQANSAFQQYRNWYEPRDSKATLIRDETVIAKWLGREANRQPPERPTAYPAIIGLAHALKLEKITLIALLTFVPALAGYYDPSDPDAILRQTYELACSDKKYGKAYANALRDLIAERWEVAFQPLPNGQRVIRRKVNRPKLLLFAVAVSMSLMVLARSQLPPGYDFDEVLQQHAKAYYQEMASDALELTHYDEPQPYGILVLTTGIAFPLLAGNWIVVKDVGDFSFVCNIGYNPESTRFITSERPLKIFLSGSDYDTSYSCEPDDTIPSFRGCELALYVKTGGGTEQIIPDPEDQFCSLDSGIAAVPTGLP